jgi:integrase
MNKVHIFSVVKNEEFHSSRDPKASQYRVKWRVQGRDKTRSFRTKGQAEHFWRRLCTSLEDGATFDPTTGLPLSWTQQHKSFAEVAQEYVQLFWSSHEAASLRSTVEALSYSVIHLTRSRSANPYSFSDLTRAAKYLILHPSFPGLATAHEIEVRDWILKNSLKLSEINAVTTNKLLEKLQKSSSGDRQLSPTTLRKRRQALHATFELAVRQNYLKENPLKGSLFKKADVEWAVNPERFLTPAECRESVELLDSKGESGQRVGTFVSLLWLAGLRPGEALGLRKRDLVLLKSNPRILISQNVVQVGKAWTSDGQAQAVKQPKSRALGSVRVVPIPDELRSRLRKVVKSLEPDDLLFANTKGDKPLSLTVFEDAWVDVRKGPTRLYDLRHTNASILIYSGLNIIEVANRLGHSVHVCARTYLHVLSSYDATSNAQINAFLKKKKKGRR